VSPQRHSKPQGATPNSSAHIDEDVARVYLYRYRCSVDAATLIRETRRAAGLSQAALAQRAGTSQPAVARYEAGGSSPSVRTLERLLHAAGQRLTISAEPAGAQSNLSGSRMAQLRRAKPDIVRLARRAGARNVRVFGSVARGEDRPDSDTDLLVDFDSTGPEGIFPLVALRLDLAELLGHDVDVAAPDLLRPQVAKRALAEAVPL
jgi:predicted nucleotidyltransferase/DNA-binding XRE family transcriptional regulator